MPKLSARELEILTGIAHTARPTPPPALVGHYVPAGDVKEGSLYHELSDRPNNRPFKVERITRCIDPANVHLSTSRGDWCIARAQQFTR